MKKINVVLFAVFAILFVAISYKYYQYREHFEEAEHYVAALAEKMNEICNEHGQCPDRIKDWQEVEGEYSYFTQYGPSSIPIYFLCRSDKKEFVFFLKHKILSGVDIKGGVGKSILIVKDTSNFS